jgi:hypothetical protein
MVTGPSKQGQDCFPPRRVALQNQQGQSRHE